MKTNARWAAASGAMEAWLADPQLLEPDADADYAAVIEIDLADIHEPIVACPNDPDDVKTLSDVAGAKIDEVFIGSRRPTSAISARRPSCWKASAIFRSSWGGAADQDGRAAAHRGRPLRRLRHGRRAHRNAGLLAVHGNQAQVREGATVMSTSTRNFPTAWARTPTYLPWAELAAICSRLGRIPTREEYMADMGVINKSGDQIYQYLNFDRIPDYKRCGRRDRGLSRSSAMTKGPAARRAFLLLYALAALKTQAPWGLHARVFVQTAHETFQKIATDAQ